MKSLVPDALKAALRLTKAGRLTEATAAIQHMLSRQDATAAEAAPDRTIDGTIDVTIDGAIDRPAAALPAAVPAEGHFLAAIFTNPAGSRPFRLYVPSEYHGQPMPLVVMLHGCTQSPEDFAAGTRMNEAAEANNCLVAYPGQTSKANMQRCWNWFNAGDQQRDSGEPLLIAGITREVMRGYAVDRRRVYVAGLSAGGAAAAIMGETYPDLYAAIGVHSGLACGAARDMGSAFAAMKNGPADPAASGPAASGSRRPVVPTIVFHGDQDSTVNPRNADAVVVQSGHNMLLREHSDEGRTPGGRAFRVTRRVDAAGRTVIEQWLVKGGGHAWFGGSPAGTYTDPRGPDATREMLRFFLEHPREAG